MKKSEPDRVQALLDDLLAACNAAVERNRKRIEKYIKELK